MNKKRGREQGDAFIVGIGGREEVGAARKGIGSSKMGTRDMGQLEVKVCKVKEPMSLTAVEPLGGTKEREVFMIGENLDRKQETM